MRIRFMKPHLVIINVSLNIIEYLSTYKIASNNYVTCNCRNFFIAICIDNALPTY